MGRINSSNNHAQNRRQIVMRAQEMENQSATNLKISKPDDEHEKEADKVSRSVTENSGTEKPKSRKPTLENAIGTMRMTGASEEQIMRYIETRKNEEMGTGELAEKLQSSKGSGQELEDETREEMESKMGADLSGVKIHTDHNAHEMAEGINAKAFTHGQDIYFKQGNYNTNSTEGKHLLAHELTHTVQQGENTIQRTIDVGGKPFTLDDKTAKEIEKKLSKKYEKAQYEAIIEIIYEMRLLGTKKEEEKKNTSKTNLVKTKFEYKDIDALIQEAEMRFNMVQTMKKVETSGNFGYGAAKHIDGYYWEPLGKSSIVKMGSEEPKFRYNPKPEVKNPTPADAVNAIFKPTDGLPVILECNSMMTAIQYKSMLDTYGAKQFNKMFPNGKGLIIGPVAEKGAEKDIKPGQHNPGTDYPEYTDKPTPENKKGKQLHPFLQMDLYERTTFPYGTFTETNPPAGLAPGDWVYFQNHAEYSQYPISGEFSGEHAMYLGFGKFTGFGLGMRPTRDSDGTGYTYGQLLDALQKSYETVYSQKDDPKPEKRKLTKAELPGITVLFRQKMDKINSLKDQ